MIWGVMARADRRGLGHLTRELVAALGPDRVLVVREPGAESMGFEPHLEWYPGATVVVYDPQSGALGGTARAWLEGLDLVYCAETAYDRRFFRWCRELGVVSVMTAMPEFFSPERNHERDQRPDVVWAPTGWRLDRLGVGVEVVPVPVAATRFNARQRERAGTFLHVVGRRAMADRAGTTTLLRALRLVREPMRVVITTQGLELPIPTGLPSQVEVVRRLRSGGEYWELYELGDVLVHPRRYGGLNLVANEAAAAGLALVLPECAPNEEWPAALVPGHPAPAAVATQAGRLVPFDTDPVALAAVLDVLCTDPARVAALSSASLVWARDHSWAALAPLYRAKLMAAAA